MALCEKRRSIRGRGHAHVARDSIQRLAAHSLRLDRTPTVHDVASSQRRTQQSQESYATQRPQVDRKESSSHKLFQSCMRLSQEVNPSGCFHLITST